MRRLGLLVCAVVAVAETYRRGYAAPLLFGGRQWLAAFNRRELNTTELDYLA